MDKTPKLSGKEKAMIFLAALGDDASAKVLKCLPEQTAKKISEELNYFPKPSKERIAFVFKELNKLALKPGPEEEAKMAQAIAEQLGGKEKFGTAKLPIDPLEKIDAQELLQKLQNEQVQTIAFVLSFISQDAKGRFYQLLSPGRRKEISGLAVRDTAMKAKIKEEIKKVLLAV